LTALGDLLGTAFLYFAFYTLNLLKPEDLINHSTSVIQQNNDETNQQQHSHKISTLSRFSMSPIFLNNLG
jgi:hypothetical protein